MKPFVLLACLSLLPALPAPQEGEKYLRWLLESLDGEDPTVRQSSFTALLKEDGAVQAALEDFSAATRMGRQLRARLIWKTGDPAHASAVEKLLKDPDLEVRRQLARYFSRPDVSRDQGEVSLRVLSGLAQGEDLELAKVALEGLARSEDSGAADNLRTLIRDQPPKDLLDAALQALVSRHDSGEALLALARDPGPDRSYLSFVFMALGDKAQLQAVPILLESLEDPAREIQIASRQALTLLHSRLVRRQRLKDAEWLFRSSRNKSQAYPEILLQESNFHLNETGDLAKAREAASLFEKHFSGKQDRDAALGRTRAAMSRAQVAIASRAGELVETELDQAIRLLDEIWITVDEDKEPEVGLQLAVFEAKARLLRALNRMVQQEEGLPGASKAILEAYEFSRKAKGFQDRWLSRRHGRQDSWVFQPDVMFSGEFGLYPLLQISLLRELGAEEVERIWLALGEILGQNFPYEFVPLPPAEIPKLSVSDEMTLRSPSRFPVMLANYYQRVAGDDDRALEILQRVSNQWRLRLNMIPWFATEVADVESAIAGILMDRREGEETEKTLKRGVALLEDLQRWQTARQGGEAGKDPAILTRLAAFQVSLAVNENVVKGRPEAARRYLEKAYELEPSLFNRVLLACYHARAGEKEEALRIVASIEPEPSLFYNLACTYALMGEKREALKFLEWHFQSFDPTAKGELENARDWARQDPDLEGLRKDSRFLELVGGGDK